MGGSASTNEVENSRQQRSKVTTRGEKQQQQKIKVTTREEKQQQQKINVTTQGEKCYDPRDTSLIFTEEDDILDFLLEGFESRRAKMSCGHAVTPTSLTKWCCRLLNDGECRFVCGVYGCDVEWSFEEVCKMALLTPEEIEDFEKKMFHNSKSNLRVKECPGCQSCVARTDLDDLSVICRVCTAEKKTTFKFCWQCLREWKGPVPRSDRCENENCGSPLNVLKTCPDIIFEKVKRVTGCPSIRACPSCGSLVEHNGTECKNVVCGCKVQFCFVCLKLTEECKKLDPYFYFGPCSAGVAPRQTSIPGMPTQI